MNEHDVSELLREANAIDVADLPDPQESPEAQRLLASILSDVPARVPREPAERGRRREAILRHRVALGFVAALVLAGVIVAAAVFPGSSKTSSGLSKVSTRGSRVSFSKTQPKIRGLGAPYVLAELGGKAFFRVERNGESACYGSGKLTDGKLDVLLLDCTPFPSASMPVLADQIGVDVSNGKGGGRLLFADGFAADGVAELRLIARSGRIIATAPVKGNVFRLEGVAGVEQAGAKLIALDPHGHEVWSRIL